MSLFSAGLSRVFFGLCTCLALLGCSGASWEKLQLDSPYDVPKRLTIAVVQGPATDEALEALTSALVDELSSHGIKVTIVTEGDRPDATVSIEQWDGGSRGLRWFLGFGAGEGDVSVDVASVGVDGRAHGWVAGGFFGGSDEDSADAAGRMIAYTLATGQRD
ncbi:MAG TPA: DUF4410 domain-containing protein [Polyangiaceae bacterium]|nr:DUF4410 domain-containing protein [Polyangiaceae bacterium]